MGTNYIYFKSEVSSWPDLFFSPPQMTTTDEVSQGQHKDFKDVNSMHVVLKVLLLLMSLLNLSSTTKFEEAEFYRAMKFYSSLNSTIIQKLLHCSVLTTELFDSPVRGSIIIPENDRWVQKLCALGTAI